MMRKLCLGVCVLLFLPSLATRAKPLDMRPSHCLMCAQQPSLRESRNLVIMVQRALAEQGYYGGSIDGIIGPQTRQALRNFQRAHKLPITGRLDERTVDALGVELGGDRTRGGDKGFFSKVGSGAKTVGGAVSGATVKGAKATKKGVVKGSKATAQGATTAGKATAKGATVTGKTTAGASSKAATATGKGVKSAGRAIKGVFSSNPPDEDIHYAIRDKFKQDPKVNAAHFDIEVSHGTVTLTLREGDNAELDRATALAREVNGVRKVVTRRR